MFNGVCQRFESSRPKAIGIFVLVNLTLQTCHREQGRTLGGLGGGAKPPLASECDLKSVPFFFDTVLKLRPKIRVERRRINIYFCQ